ncbi:MAG: carbohydrate ABC transporter permease [Bacilli bacterium]|nr:carbohydrate ABC transporter permease [Bacilli bacterium]
MTNNPTKIRFKDQLRTRYQEFRKDWDNPIKKRVRSKKAMEVGGNIIRAFILIGLSFIILLPLLQKFSFALRYPTDITDPQVIWIPGTFSFENIRIAYHYLSYNITFINSIVLSFFSMCIQIIATATAGYAFARLKFPGSKIFFYLVLFTLVVPNETLDLSRWLFFQSTNFFGIDLIFNVFSIYIMSAFGMGLRSAIFIYLFVQFFRNLPIELEESAEIDGAGVIRTFWSVMLPNAGGATVTVGLFAFVWQYNDYYYAHLYRFERVFPVLTTKLAAGSGSLSATMVTSFGELLRNLGDEIKDDPLFFGLVTNTAALLMMLPLLIAYFFIQKLFVESIGRTGITGM